MTKVVADREAVELFHFLFLRQLASAGDRSNFTVKGKIVLGEGSAGRSRTGQRAREALETGVQFG